MPMLVLHLLRSEPDLVARRLIEEAYPEEDRILVRLYTGNVDYEQLVRQIFDSDWVISWWSGKTCSTAREGESNE